MRDKDGDDDEEDIDNVVTQDCPAVSAVEAHFLGDFLLVHRVLSLHYSSNLQIISFLKLFYPLLAFLSWKIKEPIRAFSSNYSLIWKIILAPNSPSSTWNNKEKVKNFFQYKSAQPSKKSLF